MKKRKKLICILLVLAMAFLSMAASKAQRTYNKAQDQLADGNYAKAAELFDSIGSYENAAILAMYCKAAALGESGKYEEAVSAFEMLEDFKDSIYMAQYYEICSYAFADDATWEDKLDAAEDFDDMMLFRDCSKKAEECRESVYQTALALKKNGEYEEAIEIFDCLDYFSYKDSAEQINICINEILEIEYQNAAKLYKDEEYEVARDVFYMLYNYNNYKDSKEQGENCENAILERDYKNAQELYKAGEYEAAITAFTALEDYKDSKEKIENCENAILERDYKNAQELYKAGEYEAAITAFTELGDYKDSSIQIENCKNGIKENAYQEACTLKNTGKYEEAYAIFRTLAGYKDVDSILKNDKDISAARKAQYAVGKTATFGSYEQDNNTANGEEPIEWQVLVNDGNKALLISRCALDCQQYNTKYTDVTWTTCTLRTWLNSDFYNTAFSAEEQKQIIKTTVSADKNPKYSTDPGKSTEDKVFLLSITEAEKYLTTYEARKCAPTAYAIAQGGWTSSSNKTADGVATCWWWLRSPGDDQHDATDVSLGGSVYYAGGNVDNNRGCVRPALWINLGS